MQWSGLAMASRERGGALVATAVTTKRKATLPRFKGWRWWLEEVGVMVEQLWPRGINRWSCNGGERARLRSS